MYFIRYFLILVVIIYFPIVKADEQLMVVTSASPQSVQAKLTRYERSTNHHWHKVGKPVQVVVGKSGITKHKLEGDGATPAGKFSLGTAFGFAPKPDFALKLAYLPITETMVCVNDLKSNYYNHIIDSSKVKKSDWVSGEQMKEKVPQYTWGLVVNYNLPTAKPGAGSCIFMNVWKDPNTGTVGDVAMAEEDMKSLLTWLDPSKNPRLIITSHTKGG